jgi:hypothetical protein
VPKRPKSAKNAKKVPKGRSKDDNNVGKDNKVSKGPIFLQTPKVQKKDTLNTLWRMSTTILK